MEPAGVAGSKIEKRWEVLSLDEAFAPAVLYDLAGRFGLLTGAANHTEMPFRAQSLHDTMPALFSGHWFFSMVFCRDSKPKPSA
jgi:hypothetical protein